ncbi:MAG: helix-turn-helix transcriptional regulator [Ruminococcaceae bacterium]|nr:helix-turn-helix transcriptional regulator [Oscillospiraceae bacterium]
MSYYDFGDILKTLRKNNGLTQSELGRHVGLSKAVVSKYETGIGYHNFETLIRIAKYFGVTTDYLLGEEKGKTVDVSELTESQAEIIHRTVAEFAKANKKSHR